MSNKEKLRALLAEARLCVAYAHRESRLGVHPALLASIDAALAEPVEPLRDCICTGPWVTGHRHTDICREFRAMRAECERQMEYGVKQHEVAQDCIREAQKWKKQRDEARAEVERLRAEVSRLRGDLLFEERINIPSLRVAASTAFRRGAEAMREAAAQVARKRAVLSVDTPADAAWCRSAACVEEEIRAMPLPEDK